MASPDASLGLAPVWAVVPLRGLASAKTRLATELDAAERLALVTEMARRTLAACRDARSLTGAVLVTLDPAAARLAESFGALTIVQRLPGLNDAIREGRALAVAEGARTIVVLPIDLPRISPDAIDALVATAAASAVGGSVVALVPDRHGVGTNALLVSPPAAIEPSFGIESHGLHAAAARSAGIALAELAGPLSLDVDTPSDLLAAADPDADPDAVTDADADGIDDPPLVHHSSRPDV